VLWIDVRKRRLHRRRWIRIVEILKPVLFRTVILKRLDIVIPGALLCIGEPRSITDDATRSVQDEQAVDSDVGLD